MLLTARLPFYEGCLPFLTMPATSSEAVRVTFESTAEDVEKFYLASWHASNKARSRVFNISRIVSEWRNLAIAFWVMSAILAGVGWFRDESLFKDLWFPGCVAMAIYSTYNAWKTRKIERPSWIATYAKKMASDPSARLALGRNDVEANGTGLRLSTDHFDALYRWPMITRVVDSDDAMIFHSLSGVLLRIPNRAFTSECPREAFLAAANRHIRTLGFDATARLLEFTQRERSSCVGCNYPLVGLAIPRCPECGRDVTFDDFPLASHFVPDESDSSPQESQAISNR